MMKTWIQVDLKIVESRLAEADACQAWCLDVNKWMYIHTVYIPFILMDLFIIE